MKEKLLKLEVIITSLPDKIKALYCNFTEELHSSCTKLRDIAATNYNLGIYHINKGNIRDARFRFWIVTKLRPNNSEAHYNLARCYQYDLKINQAKEQLLIVIALNPSMSQAKYRLAVLNHDLNNLDIPIQVIEEDYNMMACKYEEDFLEQKKYEAPEKLVSAISEFIHESSVILDLGCGTGLVGAYLAEKIKYKSLVGVDISENMLSLAKELKAVAQPIYHKALRLDFNEAEVMKLTLAKEKFDIIVACMSLSYSNRLDLVFKGLSDLSQKGSIFAITLIKSASQNVEFDYEQSSIAYSESFLLEIFKSFKWKIIKKEEIKIFATKTPGLLFILEKS